MMRLILGVAAALILSTGHALADGLPYRGHVKDTGAVPNWTGFYVGVGVGAGAVVHDLTVSKYEYEYEYEGYWRRALSFDGVGGEGVFGTIIVGYDRVIRPGWVAGVFVDYDFSGISTSLSAYEFSASLDHTHSWSVGARLGMLSSPTTLWYATAGYTRAEFDLRTSEGYWDLRSPSFDGYFVGAGVESILRGNWSLRLEYRFTQFQSETIADWEGTRIDLEPSMHTARLVLSYKLGHRD